MNAPALALLALLGALPQPPALPPGAELSRAAPGAQASLMVGLQLRDRAGLDALIAAQHEPASPEFRRWLTPSEFGARFGVPSTAYDTASRELARTGMKVERFPSRLLLHATGSVSQVERLLGVTLWDVRLPDGRTFRTFRGAPHVGDALSAELESLSGLDTRPRFKRRLTNGQYDAFGPQDLRRYYDASPLHAQGFGGQLSRVGVVGPIPDVPDYPDPADLSYFYAAVADAPVHYQLVDLGLQGTQPDQQGDKDELEMDAEMSTVAAPLEQSVTMVLGPSDTMFLQGMGYFANVDYTVTAVSTSYGDCEADELYFYPDEIYTLGNIVAQGSAEGISWFAAAGDNGIDDCGTGPAFPDGGGGDGPNVDYPGSLPYMASVGGTTFTGNFDADDAVTSYGLESTWNSGQDFGAGGGGTSQIFPKPSYQVGFGDSASLRDVPDFSLLADPEVGVMVDDTRPGLIDASGGTSDAAPMAAGVFALVNDFIGGCRIGAPQFELYRLGANASTRAQVFHDITTGDVSQNGIVGASAHAGFDDATGWGSLDIAQLAAAWPRCSGAGTTLDAGGPLYGDAGYPLDGGTLDPGEYDGGIGVLDAGPRAAYDACAVLACDGGATCTTTAEGPSACVLGCNPSGPNLCPAGQYCDPTASTCVPGCGSDGDCASGQRCDPCAHACSPVYDGGAIGDPCLDDTVCPTFGFCLTPDPSPGVNLPDGYCSADCDPSTVACSCPPGSQCDPYFALCFRTCSVAAQGVCADAQVCNDFQNGDQGVCLPACRTDEDCDFGDFQDTCDRHTHVCVGAGTASSSSASSTSTTGTSGSSASTGTSGSGSSSTSSTSGSTAASTTGTAGSTGTHGSSGATTGTTGATAAGSTGTTGTPPKSSGCGCSSGAELEAPLGILLGAIALLRRRRRG